MTTKAVIRRLPGVVSSFRFRKRAVAIIRRGCHHKCRGVPGDGAALTVCLHPDGRHRFVGYYDHSPFKPGDERLLVVHSTRHAAWRRPTPHVPVRIELVDHQTGAVERVLGQSYAWNWQQGARALWLNSETVVFNIYDRAADRYRARMMRCDGVHVDDIPIPVQEVDSRGRVCSLSYEALAEIRPDYGYRNRVGRAQDSLDNAIEQFDPSVGTHRTLVNLATLKERTEQIYGVPITHPKFNHVMASPEGTRLVFLFRYIVSGRRVTDLYEISTSGGAPHLLVADGGVSHVCWCGDHAVFATMSGSSGFGYYRLQIGSGLPTLLWAQPDGHPTYLKDGHILTDTYPDRYAIRHLLIRSMETGKVTELGGFREPLLYQGETRCDLHPTVSPSGRYIQVDCAKRRRRTIGILPNPLWDGGRL